MPTHDIAIELPAKAVLRTDVRISVDADGSKLGELLISKGSIDGSRETVSARSAFGGRSSRRSSRSTGRATQERALAGPRDQDPFGTRVQSGISDTLQRVRLLARSHHNAAAHETSLHATKQTVHSPLSRQCAVEDAFAHGRR